MIVVAIFYCHDTAATQIHPYRLHRSLHDALPICLEQALDSVRSLPPDQQDLVALEMLERAQALLRQPTRITPQERAELEAELAAARRGELATDRKSTRLNSSH